MSSRGKRRAAGMKGSSAVIYCGTDSRNVQGGGVSYKWGLFDPYTFLCTDAAFEWDWLLMERQRVYTCGTGFSREGNAYTCGTGFSWEGNAYTCRTGFSWEGNAYTCRTGFSWEGNAYTCRTGFSREGVGCHTANVMSRQVASSRLKPVLLTTCIQWD
jgi:hypothetical protein